jgi:superoxide dismutase, Cu-Zn family
MNAHRNQSISGQQRNMKLYKVLATFCRDLRTRMGTALILIVSLVVLIAPARAWNLSAEVKLHNTAGHQVGKARFIQLGGGDVVVEIRVRDLPPGFHGFHVHAVGDCTPPFTSAGAHFDKGANNHRNHSGDLPVLLVNADGTADALFDTDRFELADLFDADGSALIIHADPDNYANIPGRYGVVPDAMTLATGDSGARIACGVIEKFVKR